MFLNQSATAKPNASDATAGLASSSCGALNTGTLGVKSVTCTATDKAGNTATATATYTIVYDFNGFSGVSTPPKLNSVKAGAQVAISFGLAGDQGPAILAPNSPTSQQVDCGSKALVGSAAATNPAGSSGLSYLAKKKQYTYAWQTDSAWAGTCRQFSLSLSDGTQHVVLFRFS